MTLIIFFSRLTDYDYEFRAVDLASEARSVRPYPRTRGLWRRFHRCYWWKKITQGESISSSICVSSKVYLSASLEYLVWSSQSRSSGLNTFILHCITYKRTLLINSQDKINNSTQKNRVDSIWNNSRLFKTRRILANISRYTGFKKIILENR